MIEIYHLAYLYFSYRIVGHILSYLILIKLLNLAIFFSFLEIYTAFVYYELLRREINNYVCIIFFGLKLSKREHRADISEHSKDHRLGYLSIILGLSVIVARSTEMIHNYDAS